ncbi:MAG: hypothetical protein H7256_11770 [Bdellovibrio sp.]|nr:hypothetical protein [Bdellovibrio sp.]
METTEQVLVEFVNQFREFTVTFRLFKDRIDVETDQIVKLSSHFPSTVSHPLTSLTEIKYVKRSQIKLYFYDSNNWQGEVIVNGSEEVQGVMNQLLILNPKLRVDETFKNRTFTKWELVLYILCLTPFAILLFLSTRN